MFKCTQMVLLLQVPQVLLQMLSRVFLLLRLILQVKFILELLKSSVADENILFLNK